MSLNDLSREAYQNSFAHGFYPQGSEPSDDNVGEKLALIHSEISEVLEEVRAGHGLRVVYYTDIDKPKPEGVPIELADALIRIFDFCGRHGIDIDSAVEEKMKYNESRPYKHGKTF